MGVVIHCLFAELLLVTSAIGFLFTRNLPDIPQTTTSKRPPAFFKLLRNSEDTIRWLGNKTADSLNGLFNLNQTFDLPSTSSPTVDNKMPFLTWLKSRFHLHSSSLEYSEETEEDDSGDSLVIAHRTLDEGFSWGPAPIIQSHATAKPIDITRRPLDNSITYIKNKTLSLAISSHNFFKNAISSVFAKKNPFMTYKLTPEAIEKGLARFWNKQQLLKNITVPLIIKKLSNN